MNAFAFITSILLFFCVLTLQGQTPEPPWSVSVKSSSVVLDSLFSAVRNPIETHNADGSLIMPSETDTTIYVDATLAFKISNMASLSQLEVLLLETGGKGREYSFTLDKSAIRGQTVFSVSNKDFSVKNDWLNFEFPVNEKIMQSSWNLWVRGTDANGNHTNILYRKFR